MQHAWHLYPLRLRTDKLTITRDRMIEELRARNIGTSVHFIPIHTFTYYRDRYGFKPEDFPVAMDCTDRVISLPLHPGLSDSDVGDVVEAVRDVIKTHGA